MSATWIRIAAAGAWVLACSPAPPPAAEPLGAASERPEDFSAERAWAHVEALAALAPRSIGSQGAASARDYIRDQLRALGTEPVEQAVRSDDGGELRETVNLVARIPGESPEAILLVAPYDSPGPDQGTSAEADASGAALLLELARALEVQHPRYSLWIAFVEGDAATAGSGVGFGTAALAQGLAADGTLERIRLAVYFDRVASPDLRIARDLRSVRSFREEFWAEGRRQGEAAIFPPEEVFESVESGHRALLDAGVRRTVVIRGASPAGEPTGEASAPAPPGTTGADAPTTRTPAAEESSRSARESLGAVGRVCLGALRGISERLARIDRFSSSPIGEAKDGDTAPEAQAAGEPQQGSNAAEETGGRAPE